MLIVYFMKTCVYRARLAALPLALAAAFPTLAQTLPAASGAALKETVVTATRFAEPNAVTAYGVSVITAEEIKNSGAATVNEAISKLLGVPARIDFFGSGNSTLDLRGFGPSATSNQVVVVDGLRLNEADLSSPLISGIAIESVQSIEVLRGNGAVLYGEGATGGVIVITTKSGKGAERPNSAQLSTSFGSYGLRETSASATLGGGGFSVDITANQRQTNNHRDNFKSKIDGLSLTGQWQNDWLRMGVRYGRDDLQSGLPGSLSATQYAANPRQTLNPFDKGEIKSERYGVFAEAKLGDWQLAFDAGKRVKSNTATYSGFVDSYQVDADSLGLRARHESKSQLLGNALSFGIDNNNWQRRIPGAFGSVSDARSQAFYVKDDVTLLSTGTRLSVGLRTEQIKKSLDSPALAFTNRQRAWDVGLTQPFLTNAAVFGRFGQSYRLANADEFSFALPNTVLLPQTSRDQELGLRWRDESTKAELRMYRSDIKNEIGYDPAVANANSFSGVGANVNFDPTRRQGVELELKQSVTAAIDVRANAALRSARFQSGVYAGKDVPLVPRQTLAVRADWRFAAAQQISAGVQWVGAQRPDFDNACSMPSYATLDTRYAYKFTNAELSLGVTNLTNNKYYSQAFACTGGVTQGIYPDAGRAATATLRVHF